jgi:hypothetical protein
MVDFAQVKKANAKRWQAMCATTNLVTPIDTIAESLMDGYDCPGSAPKWCDRRHPHPGSLSL